MTRLLWSGVLADMLAVRRLFVGLGMIALLVVSLGASQLTPEPAALQPKSIVDRWLEPQTVIGIALVLLYVGEVRGDLKRTKERLAELTDDKLAARFMSRELIEEKLRHLEHGRERHP